MQFVDGATAHTTDPQLAIEVYGNLRTDIDTDDPMATLSGLFGLAVQFTPQATILNPFPIVETFGFDVVADMLDSGGGGSVYATDNGGFAGFTAGINYWYGPNIANGQPFSVYLNISSGGVNMYASDINASLVVALTTVTPTISIGRGVYELYWNDDSTFTPNFTGSMILTESASGFWSEFILSNEF